METALRLRWKASKPSGPSGTIYSWTSGPWTLAKSSVRGVWQYTLYHGAALKYVRYPATGPGFASAELAMAEANRIEFSGGTQ